MSPSNKMLLNMVRGNNLAGIMTAVKGGADVRLNDSELLVVAASLNYRKVIILLTSLGADFNSRAYECLFMAKAAGHKQLEKWIQNEIWDLEAAGAELRPFEGNPE